MFFIISQIFAFLTLCAGIIGFQARQKNVMLIWIVVANVSLTISYVLLSAWVGAALLIVCTARTIGFIILNKYRQKTPHWLDISVLIFFLIVNCAATYLTWSMWFEFLLLGGALLATYGFWSKSEHTARICSFVFSSLLIIFDILVSNWVAIAVEASVLISIIVYYIRNFTSKKKLLANSQNVIIQP